MIKEAIAKAVNKKDLTKKESEAVIEEIMTGTATPSQIACFLTALRMKGETVDEITGAALVMRTHATKIPSKSKIVLDTCGTGGDEAGTFNISTISAFVAAGAGATVAKHGNRSVSSKCGSADLLEELGINIEIGPDEVKESLDKIGIGFLFAPALHQAMKYATPVRREIGIRTVFNILGPLTNPAGATNQLIGVYDEKFTEIFAGVLNNLGSKHALIVYGKDGLDEVTTTTDTVITELKAGKIETYKINPEDFGFSRAKLSDLKGADSKKNAEIAMNVLSAAAGPHRDIVLMNAGCALYAADHAPNIKSGIESAKESIDSKNALRKMEQLRDFTRKVVK